MAQLDLRFGLLESHLRFLLLDRHLRILLLYRHLWLGLADGYLRFSLLDVYLRVAGGDSDSRLWLVDGYLRGRFVDNYSGWLLPYPDHGALSRLLAACLLAGLCHLALLLEVAAELLVLALIQRIIVILIESREHLFCFASLALSQLVQLILLKLLVIVLIEL